MARTPWSITQTVNTITTDEQYALYNTLLADGSFVVTWNSQIDSNDIDILFQRFDAAGNKLGGPTLAHAASTSIQNGGDVVALSTGGFVVVSVTNGLISAQKFAATGIVDGPPINVTGPAWNSQEPPKLVALPNGEFAVFYPTENFVTSTSTTDIVGRIVSASGVPGPAFEATSFQSSSFQDNGAFDVTSDAAGNMFVTYETVANANRTYLALTRLSSTGAVLGDSDVGANPVSAGYDLAPSVARLSNGNIVVTFQSDYPTPSGANDIRGQIYDSNGVKVGAEFAVNGNTYGIQTQPQVTALSNGRFLIVYNDNDYSLHAQVFNQDGTRAGVDLVLNTSSFTFDLNALTLADGRVSITWSEFDVTSGTYEARMQILDPREGVFNGTSGSDKIYGNDGGNDFITGNAGADTIYGLRGNDTIYGDAGGDFLFGDRGDDTLYGGSGIDYLYGGLGDDEIYGGADNDLFYSGAGTDLFNGEAGNDTIYYSAEAVGATINLNNSALNAGSALGDTLVEIERIYGTNYADILTGNSTANTLVGSGGADRLDGGIGSDTLLGGLARDTFVFAFGQSGTTAATLDKISDYAKGAVGVGDKIDFSSALTVGGVATAATATKALINATTGVASFLAGSGTTLADALADIATSMTTGGNAVGEFAFFRINNTGNNYMFISDGVAGVGVNDVVVQMTGITSIGSINLTSGDLTILT